MFDDNYAESYQIHAKKLFNTILFENHIIQLIAESIKNHPYLGLDIGSNDGSFGDQIKTYLNDSYEGQIVNIDPFINQENVIKIDNETFIEQTELLFDFIICKFSIQFMKNVNLIIQNCQKKFKKKWYILDI